MLARDVHGTAPSPALGGGGGEPRQNLDTVPPGELALKLLNPDLTLAEKRLEGRIRAASNKS